MSTPRTTDKVAIRFDTDDKFWTDWWKEWLLHGTVYAINYPAPRVIPATTLTVHEGPCEAEATAPPDPNSILNAWRVIEREYPPETVARLREALEGKQQETVDEIFIDWCTQQEYIAALAAAEGRK